MCMTRKDKRLWLLCGRGSRSLVVFGIKKILIFEGLSCVFSEGGVTKNYFMLVLLANGCRQFLPAFFAADAGL